MTDDKRIGLDFEQAVARLGLLRFNIHDCTMCGYPCGFVFDHGRIAYDSGCYCVSYCPAIRESTWSELADHYNLQHDRAAMDKFFGFTG